MIDGGVATSSVDRTHHRFVWTVTGIVAVALWIAPLRASLWTDELGTWWVIRDGWSDAATRAFEFHGQSPLFYLVLWATRHVLGRSEVALRLPSLLAATGAAFLLYRLVRRQADPDAAGLSVLAFIGIGGVAFAANDARPYAFGLLVVIAAASALVRWLDEGSVGWGAAFVALSVTSVWVHYVLALMVPVFLLYALVRVRRGSAAPPAWAIVLAAALIAVGVIPLAAQLASLWSRRGSLAVANVATMSDLLRDMVPLALLGGIGIGALIARIQGPLTIERIEVRRSAGVFALTWLLGPPITLFVLSLLSGLMLFAPRYYVIAAPAAAALFGWCVASIRPIGGQRVIAVTFAIVAVIVSGGSLKNGEDWRGAVAYTDAVSDHETLVLVHPAFVESAQRDWLDDPVRRSYLLSPLAYYPLDADPVLLPFVLDDPAEAYLAGVIDEQLGGRDRFLILTNYADVPFSSWLDGRLGGEGWTSNVVGQFGVIQVIEFTRSASGEPPPS